MAQAIEDILGGRISKGIITVKYGHLEKLHKIKTHEGGHPVPDENGYRGAQAIFRLASKRTLSATIWIVLPLGLASVIQKHLQIAKRYLKNIQ
jgi:glycerate-2-kinase